ncbi:2TM domain-containing protein [Chryseobacterium indologenes]|uniref:Histidine kinase n=1 Tax=Chryseobacterium indologenes TaxID=253 RepID=A0A0N1KSN8_CHRID|nr:2TM domain-containing protein [Chryseobacterium indologenes]KPE50568.1 histidine kinase [Chryseobacterium indologenes]
MIIENLDTSSIRYKEAEKRVKKLKGFYMSVFVYVAVNLFILFVNYTELNPGESIWRIQYFIVPIVWGIIIILYGITALFPGFLPGRKWEEKKIKELMKK